MGIAAAVAGMPLLARLVPSTLPIAEQESLDLRVLALAAGFVLLTGIAFGLAPALRAGRSNALDALRSGTRAAGGRTQRLRAISAKTTCPRTGARRSRGRSRRVFEGETNG